MLNRADIEYLKRVNAIRKRMGLSLDINQVNKSSFLSTIAEISSNMSKKKAS